MNPRQDTQHPPGSGIHASRIGFRCLPEVLSVLRQTRIALVRFEYSGQVGARRIKPTAFHDHGGRVIDARIPKKVRQDIDVFLHEVLESRFPDWADAEGSRGELDWDVVADDLEHRHSLRQIVYETVTLRGLEPFSI